MDTSKNNQYTLQLSQLNIIIAIIFLAFYNLNFWKESYQVINPSGILDFVFFFSIFFLLLIIINLLLTLLCSRYSYKVIYTLLFICSASSLYFISKYGILIDRDMIQNIVETRHAEAKDLINLSLIMYLLVLGILPIFVIYKIPIQFGSFKQEFFSKTKIIVASLILIIALLFINYASFASMARSNRQISHLIIPTNFIFATVSFVKQHFKISHLPFKIITKEAKLGDRWKTIKNKTVLVLVVGETARADRFGINGYEKQTTPHLATREINDFSQTYACGTSTAVSLPCMFSYLERENYSQEMAKNTENLLDFFIKTNFSVQWRDNNTGCKGLCDRAQEVDLTEVKDNPLCSTGECFDEILLHNLKKQIVDNPKNQIIVLHQKGSHGPSYYLRYPQSFEKFKPICKGNQLQKCSALEVNNTYDNTILYTDYFLDKTIDLLQDLPSNYNTSLIYISDHGESLGENNLYLHGTPYFIAPDAQIHVPFLTWMSDSFSHQFNIDKSCLENKRNNTFSHDNLFHSVLGLMQITTPVYKPEFDVFKPCLGT